MATKDLESSDNAGTSGAGTSTLENVGDLCSTVAFVCASPMIDDRPKCPSHPLRFLSKVCKKCEEIFCDQCENRAHNGEAFNSCSHESYECEGHDLEDSDDVGEEWRAHLKHSLDAGEMVSSSNALYERVMDETRLTGIIELDIETEANKIRSMTNRLIALLRAEEDRLLRTVDAIRSRKRTRWDEHKRESLAARKRAERTTTTLVEAVNLFGPTRLLQMRSDIEASVLEAENAARQPPLRVFGHCVTFDGAETERCIKVAIKQFFGNVHDSEVCPEAGSYLVCPKRLAKNERSKVTVTLNEQTGLPRIALLQLQKEIAVVVAATDDAGTRIQHDTIQLNLGADKVFFGWFTPQHEGDVTVTTTLNGQLLSICNSPARVTVVDDGPRFHPAMCTANVSFSLDCKTVIKSDKELSNAAAFFSEGVISGCHVWRMIVKTGNSEDYWLGAGVMPMKNGAKPMGRLHLDGSKEVNFNNSESVRDGDMLIVTFDCKSRLVTAQLWRDGCQLEEKTKTAPDRDHVLHRFFPYVYMFGPNDSFTLLANP